MLCKSTYLTAFSLLILGIFFSLMAKANGDAENTRLFYSVEANQNELRSASHNLYSGTIAIESPYKSLDGKIRSASKFVVDYPAEGVTLGQGWELGRSVKSFGTCIEFKEKIVGGQIATVTASKIFSSEELKRELETSISASAKASYSGFGASASYKSTLVKKSKVESSFDTRLVKAEVVDGVEFVAPLMNPDTKVNTVALSPFALDLLKYEGQGKEKTITEASKKAFWQYCGDAYVSAIERGAEIYVVSNNFNHSAFEEVKSSKTIGGSMSYLGSGVEANTSSSSLNSALNSNNSSKYEYYHSAHRGLYIPSRIDDVAQAIQILGDSSDQNKSFPFRVQLTSYNNLPNFPTDLQLKTPMAERLYVYKDRLESIAAMLEHMLGFTLVDESDATKSCKPVAAAACVKQSNLKNYYEAGNNKRERYEELLKAVKRDILTTNKEIELCENTNLGSKDPNCIAKFDGKYNDYFYLALMPLPKVAQLYLLPKDAELKNTLQQTLNKLKTDYPNIVSRTYRVLKTCSFLGVKYKDKNLCGYKYITQLCKDNGNTAPCKQHKEQEKVIARQIALVGTEGAKKNIPSARFEYFIASRMKHRSETGAIDVELREQEIQYIKANIDCDYLGWNNEQCQDLDSIYDRIVHGGERLRFVYMFDSEAQRNRLKGYAENAVAEIKKNKEAMDTMVKEAVKADSKTDSSEPDNQNSLLQEQKTSFDLKEIENLLSNNKLLSPEQKNEYLHLKIVNSELKTLSDSLFTQLSDNGSMTLLDKTSNDWTAVITPYDLYSSLNTDKTTRSEKQPRAKVSSKKSEYMVEPLYPLISFDADFKLYVQGY